MTMSYQTSTHSSKKRMTPCHGGKSYPVPRGNLEVSNENKDDLDYCITIDNIVQEQMGGLYRSFESKMDLYNSLLVFGH